MTFPLNNPDVDPLSQNQRLNTLESLPSGRWARSGGFPDFDDYPDNAMAVYSDVGLIGKVSVPPSNNFPNADFKLCFYRELVNGAPLGSVYVFSRFYNSSPIDVSRFMGQITIPFNGKKVLETYVPYFWGSFFDLIFKITIDNVSSPNNMTWIRLETNYFSPLSIAAATLTFSWSNKISGSKQIPPTYMFVSSLFNNIITPLDSVLLSTFTEGSMERFRPTDLDFFATPTLQNITPLQKAWYPKSWTT